MTSEQATSTLPVITEHIVSTPGTCGGRPRIAGSRIRVQDIVVWHERMGKSVDEIVADYPHLTLSGVYSALAYYHDHQDAVREDFRRDDEIHASLKREGPSLIEKIRGLRDVPLEPDPASSR